MDNNCQRIPVEQSYILPGEPVPDYSYPLRIIGDHLSNIETLLREQRAQEKELHPQPGDDDEYDAGTATITAAHVTTLTWTMLPDYIYYFKKINIDSDADVSFEWTFQSVADNTKGSIVLGGNVHEFDKPVKANGNTTLTLAVTNAGLSDLSLDYTINVWSRRTK